MSEARGAAGLPRDSRANTLERSVAHVGGTHSDADRDRWLAARWWLERNDPRLAARLESARQHDALRADWVDLNANPVRDFLSETTRYGLVLTHDLWGFPELRSACASPATASSALHGAIRWRERLQGTGASYIFMFGPHFNAGNLAHDLPGYTLTQVESAPPLCVFIANTIAARGLATCAPTLSSRDMSRARLERLGELAQNHTLDLSYTALGPEHLAQLAAMPSLQELRLVGTGLGTRQLARLVPLFERLETLVLDETQVGHAGIGALAPLAKLKRLSLNRTPIGDRSLDALGELSRLAWLSLVGTAISDRGLLGLHPSRSLRYVALTRTRVSAAGVAALQRALPGCEINCELAA